MSHKTPFARHTLALLMGMTISCAGIAARAETLNEQVVGTWAYVSVDTVRPDGSRQPMFGPNPKGLAIFDGSGHYVLMTSRADIAKFESANRMKGTPEENRSVVQGSIAHFGTYTVDEAEKTITFHVVASTFPNWNGVEQKRPFVISGDKLKWTTSASSGGTAEVVLRRLK